MREDVVYASREAHVPKIFARTVLEAEIMIAITFFFLAEVLQYMYVHYNQCDLVSYS